MSGVFLNIQNQLAEDNLQFISEKPPICMIRAVGGIRVKDGRTENEESSIFKIKCAKNTNRK